MSSNLLASPFFQVLDANGAVIDGAKAYFYLTGTSTESAPFTDHALNTAHDNPVVADSDGSFAPIYLDPTKVYKIVLKDADDQTLRTYDPVVGLQAAASVLTTNLASTSSGKGAALVGINDSGALLTATTVEAALAEIMTAVNTRAGWIYIGEETASTSASLTFTGLSSTYTRYMFQINDIAPATDNVRLMMRTSTNGGSSYDSGASDYAYNVTTRYPTASSEESSTGATFIPISGVDVGNATNEVVAGEVSLFNPAGTGYTHVNIRTSFLNTATGHRSTQGDAVRLSAADVDAVQFLFSSGNIASGTIKLYGLRAS